MQTGPAMFARLTLTLIALAFLWSCTQTDRMNPFADLESRFGALPPDYRRWIDRGMELPDETFFWVRKSDWGSSPEVMYGISGDSSITIMNLEQRRDYIPHDLVLIGDDGVAATWIAIGVSGARSGKIFYIDANGAVPDAPLGHKHIYEIAPSFTSWLAEMNANPDE